MKTTAFTAIHEDLGARMVDFAGFKMPIEYTGIKDEHTNVREKLGVFDVSHMGEFWVKGPKAFSLVQRITTNDVAALYDGKVQYSCMPNGKGGIVDDLLVYRFDEETYMLVVNGANVEKDWNWVTKNAEELGLQVGKEVYNASDEISLLAVQGPLALKAMQKITEQNIMDMEFYTVQKVNIAGIKDAILSTTGYTGAGGCEIYVSNEDGPKLWKAVMEAGEEFGIKPAGLAARDTLRLEMGFALYGNDIDETTSPIEGALSWITKFVEGNDFIDREYLEKQKAEKPEKRLKPFILDDKGIPRKGYKIEDGDGNEIGEVTSGTMSPSTGQAIGLGYVKNGFWKSDTEIYIRIRKKAVKAHTTKLPFYKG
ncbi:MAG TPA: glycine cleavage system aminomethyltransferase GcvT [Salinivirga sp.]|uniref:glycine cleavage system aminomethyltransferase GcvT n=1 Tax=Salinivirga sp. TaxID=1970192 RepID=UPI002B4A3816|nr:glycine cleavage system aminomethyltransferase GcvT [Salinivirga sp.]HKK60227.1 glycine cleavage system aminomethyltransferase GcvT [Salinivirga sp.]